LRGRYTLKQALDQLLGKSGFAYSLINDHTIAVANDIAASGKAPAPDRDAPARRGGESGGDPHSATRPAQAESAGPNPATRKRAARSTTHAAGAPEDEV